MKLVVLAFLGIAWCFVHSAMISLTVTDYLKRRIGNRFRYYRLVYNGIAFVTLVPVVMCAYAVRTPPLFTWQGSLRVVQVLLLIISFLLFLSGARHYDALAFLGIRQLKQSDSCIGLTENCELDTTGILSILRHPWYTGGMLIVWARDLDVSAIVTNLVITGYFIAGTLLEERKLSTAFGKGYTEYQKKVSMFFPYKWLKSKLKPN